MKRFIALCLTIVLLVAMLPQVLAKDTDGLSDFTDISGHWAEQSISWSLEEGLFHGTSSGQFSPDAPMTRGMFVTVLGRMAGIDPADYTDWYTGLLFTDVRESAYYAPYVAWAVRMGITNGTSATTFSPSEPVTRQQMAVFIMRYVSIYNYQLSGSPASSDAFADVAQISTYATDAVESMRLTGIVKGVKNADDGYSFLPRSSATRAECATVLWRLSTSLTDYTDREVIMPEGIWISPADFELYVGSYKTLDSTILNEDATNQTITWVSSDPEVATVDRTGTVTGLTAGTADIYAYTWNGMYDVSTVTVSVNTSLASASETYEERCQRLFGEITSDPRNYYANDEVASSYMTVIPVRVWDFADDTYTTKITKTLYLQVHVNLAETVKAIFEEIYNGDEQFPIHSVGCYRYEHDSEHFSGCAIDINPEENYECTPDGTALTGYYWLPGEDPYSIPLDGDVANAFAKYGFTQGAYWNNSRDYMHFSYFAT